MKAPPNPTSDGFTTRPEILGTFGAVSTTHWLASAAGMAMLERGGNAFDAAAAAGFVLQIVEPHLNGPGGEVPIILKRPQDADPVVICGQGVYPMATSPEHLFSLGLKQMPGTGLLPMVVPGAFDAWMLLLRDYGTMRVADVLEMAIGYAENGFPVVPRISATILAAAEFFRSDWSTTAEVWLVDGNIPRPGRLFCTPAIAATYRRILAEAAAVGNDRIRQIEAARRAWYRGFVADAIDQFCRTAELRDSTGHRHKALMTGDDLARYQATVEPTVALDYHGVRVHKTGPWGQGPVFLQALALLQGFDLAGMDPLGDTFVHTVVEAMKLAFADREVFYGDPNAVEVPLERLLSPSHNDARRHLIGEYAARDMRPSDLPGAAQRMARVIAMAGTDVHVGPGGGEPTFAPLPPEWFEAQWGDTVHIEVADRWGNLISATPSGGWLQGSPVIPGLGFPLSTRGQICWLEAGHPSTLRPGMRPRTTLTPTLVTRDGEAWLGIGTPGGDQQDQWSLLTFLRILHHGMNLQQAIDAPLVTSRHVPQSFHPRPFEPGRLIVEGRYSESTISRLRARGHLVTVETPWSLGRVCAVARSGGMVRAGASARFMQGYAIGR